jgi:hypothetical protein
MLANSFCRNTDCSSSSSILQEQARQIELLHDAVDIYRLSATVQPLAALLAMPVVLGLAALCLALFSAASACSAATHPDPSSCSCSRFTMAASACTDPPTRLQLNSCS